MNIITRREASRTGQKRFYTGKPCVHGHLSERYVTTGSCIECLRGTAPDSVRFSVNVHVRDREAVELFVKCLADERAARLETPIGRDEEKYWQVIANYRKLGCPDSQLPRYYGTFILPPGIDP